MSKNFAILSIVLFCHCFFTNSTEAAQLTSDSVKSLLKEKVAPHPRLLWPRSGEQKWLEEIQKNSLMRETRQELLREARELLVVPPIVYEKIGKRLLDQSRRCLRRVTILSMAYRFTKDELYLSRAEKEMLAAAAFKDWNPSHFLDTAEMTMALATGYDWLYDRLSIQTRKILTEAILEKGLQPSLDEQSERNYWLKAEHNWNQVCHAGMVFGALAIQEDAGDLAARIIARAVNDVPYSMKSYAPDGAYPEGPDYWEYGTTFNVLLIAVLESALGASFGLTEQQGFLKTADYYLHMTGPTGLFFNYSDCGEKGDPSPAMAWFAKRLHAPYLLWNEAPSLHDYNRKKSEVASSSNGHFPLFLIWNLSAKEIPAPTALSWTGGGPNPVAVHRSSWKDPEALYLAVKAGSPSVNHGHMDAGSFVLDAGGVRWALDLGYQDYNSLESKGLDIWDRSQNSQRWKVFRYSGLSHNTLVVDGQLQRVGGFARILECKDKPFQTTLIDLSDIYKEQLASVQRRTSLLPDGTIVIEDRLTASDHPCKVRWGMATPAQVHLENPSKATLTQSGKQLSITAENRTGVTWEIYPTDPPPADYDAPNPGTRMIGFTVPLLAGEKKTLTVRLQLQGAETGTTR